MHNFPILGHMRFMLSAFGPEIRQYFVASNRDELPFNRSQRHWITSSSLKTNNYEGFGTDKDLYHPGHIFINPTMFPFKVGEDHINHRTRDPYFLPCAKVIGKAHNRRRPYRPYSIINISAMSFGSLSANAQTALNNGALASGCYHNTGEGSLSPYHSHGADVVFHIGTGYFGCRTEDGNFSMEKLVALTEKNPFIRMVEVKLSQGAKPGKGGVLPAKKITAEIAGIRGVPMGKDVISPASHKAFGNVRELVDFIEDTAEKTGLPVGIKSAIGKLEMWEELADIMVAEKKGPDFITVDGGEGGTGAAPPSFADHVALPWVFGFSELYTLFKRKNLTQDITFIGSGKLGFPADALKAFAMGADLINVAREAMISIGCIQAQECQSNKCPTGIATQSKWLQAGLDPKNMSKRFSNYVEIFRKELIEITHASGYEHPCQMEMDDVDVSCGDNNKVVTLMAAYGYEKVSVPFSNMNDLQRCEHLGAESKRKKEAETVMA